MKSKYEIEPIIEDKTDYEKNMELMNSILETKKVISEANKNYEYAEGKLIDYFLYTIKAEQAKLDYLIGKAKAVGFSVDIAEQINIKNM